MDTIDSRDPLLPSILADLGRTLATRPLERGEIERAAAALDRVEPGDIVHAVHTLVSEGLDPGSLKGAVSRLINLVSRPLGRIRFEPEDPFFESLVLENAAFLRELDAAKPLVAGLSPGSGPRHELREKLRLSIRSLAAIDLHYKKKENVLFPYFEARYPSYRCISLMWALHDDVRASLGRLSELLETEAPDGKELVILLGGLFFDAHALVFREERLLFPVVAPLLRAEERRSLYFESRVVGFCFLGAGDIASLDASAGEGAAASLLPAAAGAAASGNPTALELDSGSLDPRIVDLVLKALPVDLTFVGADDRVAYFSNGPERVFPRSPSIIGRDVRNCHPPKSVDRVLGIIEAFRRGERDYEEFWLETGGRFVRIEYRAIRGPDGGYLGTLEASQDLTRPRSLEGERRLSP